MYVYVYACVQVRTCISMYVCVCMCMHVHAVEQISFVFCTVALSFVVLGVAYSCEQFVRSGTTQINSCSVCNGQRWVHLMLSPICAEVQYVLWDCMCGISYRFSDDDCTFQAPHVYI